MNIFLDQLLSMPDCDFQIQEYSQLHSYLTILAIPSSSINEEVTLIFGNVEYIEMPIQWQGRFVLASDEEYAAMEKKSIFSEKLINYPILARRDRIELFKVARPHGNIYLLGNISNIRMKFI